VIAVEHRPVLLAEVLASLNPRPGERAVDGTLGLGGHAAAIAALLAPGGALLGIDRDPTMAARADARLRAELADRDVAIVLRHGNASDLAAHLAAADWADFDLLLFDAGVCSLHFDDAARGFSMKHDGPLDMRLDPVTGGPTAADFIARLGEAELARIFQQYGEEPNARRIARSIVEARREEPISTTGALADLVRAAYPARFRGGRRDPATRVFQALRIAVNDELGALARFVRVAVERMAVGGRGAIISFHSLEDRIVKRTLKAAAGPHFLTREDEHFGRRTPAIDLAKRISPGDEECDENPRARSATLRSFTKLRPLPAGIDWPALPSPPYALDHIADLRSEPIDLPSGDGTSSSGGSDPR
jgi:16S rRNA (cytosine1402-N4)-methyltransferase